MRTLALASLLVVLAACRIEGDPAYDDAAASCAPVSHACTAHAGCCSYACLGGVCVANERAGGICRTSDDCDFTMACAAGRCRPGLVCLPDLGDTCTSNNECCSGNCRGEDGAAYPPLAGTCAAETAPVVDLGGPFTVPYYATTTLRPTVTDPDVEDVIYYAWDVLSAPTGALTGWTSSAAAPSVFLAAKGTYVLRVRVADGPPTQRNRGTALDTVTIVAVNLPPVVSADPTGLPSAALRHTSIPLVGAVSDPNGAAAPVSCAWYARPPGGAEYAIATFPTCPASPGTSYATPIDAAEGIWEFRLEASDGELTASAVRTVEVQNAAPVALPCAYECQAPPAGGVPFVRVGNLGPPGAPAPAIPLHGSASDENGDVGTAGFSWSWSLVSAPPGSSGSAGLVRGSGTGTAPPLDGFLDPDVAGTYVVRLHVDDGRGAGADATVPVRVEPWLRPLHPIDGGTGLPRGTVVDAAYFHGASAAGDRLVYAGRDGASAADRLWVLSLDPAAPATSQPAHTALAASPLCLTVSPDGGEALVGESGPSWQRVSLSGTPNASAAMDFGYGWSSPPTALVDEGTREYGVFQNGQIRELGTSGGATAVTCEGCTAVGTRAVATTDYVWLLDEGTGELRRFYIRPNGWLQLNPGTVASTPGSHAVWLSAAHGTREVAVSGGSTFDATTLSAGASLPAAARHLDTAAPSGVLAGVMIDAAGTSVRTLGPAYAETGTLPLPRVGWLGTGYELEPVWAFVRSDGGARHVVLRAAVGNAVRWYLATY